MKITEIAKSICEAFGLKNTPLLIQFLEHEGKFYVIEFSARMGGGTKYKLIQTLSGVDIMSKYVDLILGSKPIIEHISRNVKYASLTYVYCRSGIIQSFAGFTDLAKKKLYQIIFYKTPGMKITNAETSGDRAAGYLISAETLAELNKKKRRRIWNLQLLMNMGKI